MARPLPLISSSSPPSHRSTATSSSSSVHRALSSHLHRLLSPCQLVASASSIASRRKALKELIGLIKLDHHSHAALAAADTPDRPSAAHSEEADVSFDEAEVDGSGGRYGVSWCVVIRSVISLARADHNSKRPTAEVWEALRYCVDSAERQHHILAAIGSPSLLAELVSLVRLLLSNATDAATLAVCAPAATHFTLLLLSHPPYLSHLSAASLTLLFRFYSLMYRAILSSKDEAACKSTIAKLTAATHTLFDTAAAFVPPPATLYRFGQPVAQLLSALIQYYPAAQLPDFFLDHVFPFFTAVLTPLYGQADVSTQPTCFSSSSFATLLAGLSSSLQRHYAVLHSHVAYCLSPLVSSLLACWPLTSHSGSSLQVKQAASLLLSWLFALQLHTPHRTLQCFVPFDSRHPLVVICLHELRQPLLFTQHGLDVHEEGDVITSRLAQPLTMDEGTYRFVRMCVQLFHTLELQHVHQKQRQQRRKEDDSSVHEVNEAMQAERDGDDMQDDEKAGHQPHASQPVDSRYGVVDEQRARKRRKAIHTVVDGAAGTPLQQCLSALTETTNPSLSLFYFLFLFSSFPSSSSLLFSSAVHVAVLLDVLHSLCRFMRRGKSADVRLWSITCATTLASAHHRHSRLTQSTDTQALQSSWAHIASVSLTHLLHDDKRIVRQHALSLLASLLYHRLVPQTALVSVYGLLAQLPRLLSVGSDLLTSHGTAGNGRSGVKAEVKQQHEDDVPDSQSATSAAIHNTPQMDCPTSAAKLIAACLLTCHPATDAHTAAVKAESVSSVEMLLVDWLLLRPSRSNNSRPPATSDWHQLAFRLLASCNRQMDDATTALVACPLSWAEIDVPACSFDDVRQLSPSSHHRSPLNLYPPSSPFCVSLDDVNYDSVADMDSFMQSAQFARLLPLPSQLNRPRPSVHTTAAPRTSDVTAAAFVRDQLPRLRLHVRLLLSGLEGGGEAVDDVTKIDERMKQLRLHTHFLRLHTSLVPYSDAVTFPLICCQLVAPLVGSFATLLLSLLPSAGSLPALQQLVLDMHDVAGVLLPLAPSVGWPTDLQRSYTALSSSLVLQLHGLMQRADEMSATPHYRSSSPTAEQSTSSSTMLPRDDFDGDDDGSRDDYHANSSGAVTANMIATLLAPTLRSRPAYQPCLLAIYRLLLELLAVGIPLPSDQRQALLALSEQPTVPFVFSALFLVSLHDSYIESNNVRLLIATRTVCDTATAAIGQQRQSRAAQRRDKQSQSRRGGRPKRKGRSEADMNEHDDDGDDSDDAIDTSDDTTTVAAGSDADLPAVAVEAIAFFLHLCHYVTIGHIELAHEPEIGVEQSEEDMLRAYSDTLITAAFPSSSPSPSNPLSLSPLLRCLCSCFGLASGLLASWSLPSSLFPLLSLAPSASVRTVVSHTVSRLIEFTADKQQLWQSSTQQLSDLISDVRGVQLAADDKDDAIASAGCDDRLHTLLGCMCSLACHSLHTQRQSLLRLMQVYSGAAECSLWMARSVLQQLSEAMGYTPTSVFPPPPDVPPQPVVQCTSGALSLFVVARKSVVEEHMLYLLTEWMSESTAELSGFPFELLSLASSTTRPFIGPSSPTSFLHYGAAPLSSSLLSFMPHVLRASLLHLPARQSTLRSLPSLVNEQQLSTLLALHWPSLFSLLYSLYAHDAAAMRESADRLVSFLKRELTDRTFQSLYKSHPAAPIVCQLLSLVALSPSHTALPSYGVDELSKSLIQLAQQKAANATATSVSDLLCRPGDDQLLPIILHVRASLYSDYMHERQWLWLRALETVIERLGDSVARGYVCSALLDCLVPLLDESDDRFTAHVGYVVGLTAALMQRVVNVSWQGGADEDGEKGTSGQTDMTAPQVGQHLRFVILALVNYATTDDRCNTVRGLISSLGASVPTSAQSILSPLSLLSRHPCIAVLPCPSPPSLTSVLSSFLSSFDDLSDHTNTGSMLPLLRALHSELSSQQNEVIALLHPTASATPPPSTTTSPQQRGSKQAAGTDTPAQSHASPSLSASSSPSSLLQRVMASLLLLCRSPAASVELSDWAAQCLGCVGVIDPQHLQHSYFTLFSTSSHYRHTSATDVSRRAGTTLPSSFSASFTRWQRLGGGMDFHAVSITPAALVSWFHVHRHYHHYLLYMLAVDLRSANLLRQQLSYATLLSIFSSPATAADAQTAYRAVSGNAQLLLGPFHTRSQQLQSKVGKRSESAATELSPLSSVLTHMATLPADQASSEQVLQSTTAVIAQQSAFSIVLWSTKDANREQWLTTLVFHLLRTECSDRVLSLMSDCALIDPQTAERLMPLAVMDVLCTDRVDSHQQLAHALTLSMRETLDSVSGTSALLGFLSPLLSSMQYVREQLLVLLRQPVSAPIKPALPPVSTEQPDAPLTTSPLTPAPAVSFAELCVRLKRFLHWFDPLLLAEAANALQWNNYALLWLEQWNDSSGVVEQQQPQQQQRERGRKRKQGAEASIDCRPDGLRDSHDTSRFHALLLSAYRRMDEPDALAGLLHCTPTSLTASLTADCIQAETQHDWATVLATYDIQQTPQPLMSALRNMQCSHLLSAYASTLPAASVIEQRMEMAWRNADFSSPDPQSTDTGFHARLYSVLRAMSRGQSVDTSLLSDARRGLQHRLDVLHPERVSDVFALMSQLALLAAVNDSHLLPQRWQSTSPLSSVEFDLIEPLLALQSSMLSFSQHSTRQLVSHLCFSSTLARQSDRPLLAAHNIRVAAQQLPHISGGGREEDECRLQLVHAQLTAQQGNIHAAVHEMRGVLLSVQRIRQQQSNEDSTEWSLSASTLRLLQESNSLLGEWLSKSHSESSDKVGEYLKAALQHGQVADKVPPHTLPATSPASSLSSSSASSVGALHFALGSFYDRQFQSLLAKQQTMEYQQRRLHFRRQAEAIVEDKKRLTTPEAVALLSKKDGVKGDSKWAEFKQLQRLLNTREKEHDMDGRGFKLHDAAYISHLEAAVAHYQHCLAASSQHDTFALYRFCALWFNHDRYTPMSEAKKASCRMLATLPSYKFIPLIYQIASRLLPFPSSRSALSSTTSANTIAAITDVEREWRRSVTALLLRLCLDHPHHCLSPIFALNAGSQVERVAGSFSAAFESNKERIDAARGLLKLLRSAKRQEDGRCVREVIEAQEKLYGAYVELGNRRYKREDRQVQLKDTKLDKLTKSELSKVAVPTRTLPVSADCDYSHMVSPLRFESTFHFANSGINKPLILQLLCSDGSRHKQLLKPSDDLRQDGVMEQLFALVNVLLSRESEQPHTGSGSGGSGSGGGSSGRRLKMRTYNVVPLTPGVGLVEWVNNSISLHDCLVHPTDGVHTRYQPPSTDAWSYATCMAHMRECTDHAERITRFRQVCSRFVPVFHHYFLEHFASPSSWLHHRTSYIYSMAVASMVGYIVGLGDRHIQNILLDSGTCELIHIDLGVAFDTGKLLKTPELVPFRLTRDMVDACGVGGLDGVYRRGCERVLRALRANASMVSVLLEVFVYDPLYRWTLSPNKIQQLRPDSSDASNGRQSAAADEKAAADSVAGVAAGGLGASRADSSVSSPLGSSGANINNGAYRALTAVRHRLSGDDGGVAGESLSVEGQVSALIQQATSEENLSQMYFGWSAWV